MAAGIGRRLFPLTKSMQKVMIKLNGKEIIKHSVEKVRKCGIDDIIIVTGHKAEHIRELFGSEVKYVYNPVYHKTNNIYSVWLTKDHLKDEDFILINGDDLFEIDILKKIINSKHKDCAAIDTSEKNLPEEAMKVKIIDNKLQGINKEIPKEEIDGDAIGIYKFSKEGKKALFKEIMHLLKEKQHNVFYLNAMDRMIKYHPVNVVDISGFKWFEVDDHDDLIKAKKIINDIENIEREKCLNH